MDGGFRIPVNSSSNVTTVTRGFWNPVGPAPTVSGGYIASQSTNTSGYHYTSHTRNADYASHASSGWVQSQNYGQSQSGNQAQKYNQGQHYNQIR
jgi:hypothetical protein